MTAFARTNNSRSGPVHVDAYTRRDGTHVRAHTRSWPDQGSAVSSSAAVDYSGLSYGSGGVGTAPPGPPTESTRLHMTRPAYDKHGRPTVWHPRKIHFQAAAHYRSRGVVFDAEKMTAEQMHERFAAMERAKYWKGKGIIFDPEKLSAAAMDAKVADYQAAREYAQKGMTFDPAGMTAAEMAVEWEKRTKKKPRRSSPPVASMVTESK
jgi:hypothetical protein